MKRRANVMFSCADIQVSPLATLRFHQRVGNMSMMPSGGVWRIDRRLIHRSAWKVNSANFRFTAFSEVQLPFYGVLGSSLSSGAARMRSRVRHEAPEDGVADAPLETPQRLLAGFALHHLLAVVGSAPGVRPGLAYCDHVQGVVELAVAGQRESLWRTTSPLEASTGAVPA
jgi:hypothetical protein